MLWQGVPLGLLFKDAGDQGKPTLKLEVFSEEPLSKTFLRGLEREIAYRYNLQLNLLPFYRLAENDPVMASVIQRFLGMRPMNPGSLYEYLVVAIVLQNATARRSIKMMQVLFERYGTLLNFAGRSLSCFWPPGVVAAIGEEELRSLKVGYRARSILCVSRSLAGQQIDELVLRQSTEEEQERTLLSLYGIGPASVGYLMFDVFHRWSYLKQISPWEQKIYTFIFYGRDWEKGRCR